MSLKGISIITTAGGKPQKLVIDIKKVLASDDKNIKSIMEDLIDAAIIEKRLKEPTVKWEATKKTIERKLHIK